MKSQELDKLIKDKPPVSGVYIFRDGEVPVYVGKAVDIRERLRSYRDPRTPQIAKMVENADSIDHRVTDDEKEALLLEANLIKKFQPKYNIRLKDSKSYPVIQITDDRFPAIESTRDPSEDATVFGPFTEMGRVENAIKAIRDIYGICSVKCKRQESEDDPCIDYQIGLCCAPYAGKISEKDYYDRVEEAKNFFQKDPDRLIDHIKQKMSEASEQHRFERAATLRDYLKDLENLRGNKKIRDTGIKHIIAVNQEMDRIGLVVLEENTISDKRFYSLNERAGNRIEALEAFIKQFYATDSLPERIVTEKTVEDTDIKSWLEDEGVSFGEPEDGRERVLMESAKNAAQRPEDTKMKDIGEILGIEVDRMEAFDVSHTGGTDVVGSNVVFEDDRPVKSDYRRKKLSEKNDDYENMYQLLKWRAKRQKKGRDNRPEPDLLLIDGGKGQLKAAAKALREVGWSMPVFGIVKPDDKILGLHRDPEIPKETSQILSAIRDEAHRFAINYHTSRRDKIQPVLEEIEGLGEQKRKALMNEFTIDELKQASREEISGVEGIGDSLAERVKNHFQN
jgi:excinuclease ABC subunit C